jgi:hypothetical protein
MSQPSRSNLGDDVSLNPQPLPPRWLPGVLGTLYLRLRAFFRR